MPARSRPDRRELLAALDETRRSVFDLGEDVLAHQPDLPDRQAQRLLDAWVDHAADALRAVAEALEDRMLELGRTPLPDDDAALARSGLPATGVGQP